MMIARTKFLRSYRIKKLISKGAIKIQKFYRKYYKTRIKRYNSAVTMVLLNYKKQIGLAYHLEAKITPLKIIQLQSTKITSIKRDTYVYILQFAIKMRDV